MKLLPHKIPQGILPGHRYQPKSNLCLIFGGVFSFFPLNWLYFNHFWLSQSLSARIVCGQVLFIVLTDLSPYFFTCMEFLHPSSPNKQKSFEGEDPVI